MPSSSGNVARVFTQLSSTADRSEPLVWRLERLLAQITFLKDVLEPVHFGENLVRDQCRHADELCSGVARGAVIMARACRIISGAPMVQEEFMKHTWNAAHGLIICNTVASCSKVKGQGHVSPSRKLNAAIATDPEATAPEKFRRSTNTKRRSTQSTVPRWISSLLNALIFRILNKNLIQNY